ncbi:MAG TPA: DUF1552 domain-containing protein [Polyangiaceae bacterium LLY-WYZ-15_(1-7)]|nr:hypothetical protein [Myxococcales bacterium]MAT28506.1 hypothetical protein [Sandaracinus sp.]HJL00754.1 DUF1552 domain-containing protein [Polyangiaceae bacterium LLY-WYZ-15_(1-7)]HJL09117.1 DUF1552 domain-containing protein [Polyangiaceae bacterium LLY-WYZ-15_(1-7)]HJL28177.1 DUF1552 domain-containing protein [Polyangiaceae bacterium LLY-WYZ-15_(1-7)]
MPKKMHRRTVLRGVLGGATVGVALPALEIFLNDSGTAYADGTAFPKRFAVFFWGNGVLPWKWVPGEVGTDYAMSEQLASLEDLREDMAVISGMDVKTTGRVPHTSAICGMLTGSPLVVEGEREIWEHPTVDQIVAEGVGGETRFRSLELSVQPGDRSVSYTGNNNRNPSEYRPRALYERLFIDGFRLPGEEAFDDPTLGLRRSVLDAVMDQSRRMRRRLSVADQRRLDDHFDHVRDLERRIRRIEEEPPSFDACMRPAEPPAEIPPDERGRVRTDIRNGLLSDLAAMAFACDQTRVLSMHFSQPVGDNVFPVDDIELVESGVPVLKGHHDLTHNEPEEEGRELMWRVNEITKYIVQELGVFVRALRAVPEGDGTMLNNMSVLATTDSSNPRLHSLEDFPILVFGQCGGAIRTGFHYRSDGDNASKVSLSLVRAMGVPAASFGHEAGRVTDGLGELEA